MNSGLSFQYPAWLIILCLALGLGYAAFLYYREDSFDEATVLSKWWKRALAMFRFVTVSVLAVLLLSPFIRTRHTQTFKPIVAIVQDNSESMQTSLGKDTLVYQKKVDALADKLSAKYEVALYTAGDALRLGTNASFTDKSTNLSEAMEHINDIYDNQNLGAVVLISDGMYNQGINPVYAADKADYSIYTVAVGDTSLQSDQSLVHAYYNKIVYLHDKFGVKLDVAADNFSGKTTKLNIYEINSGAEPKLLQSKDLSYTANNFFQTFDFVLSADKIGVAHYRIALNRLDGEITYQNNQLDIFVEVMDGRQKILLIANSPHPDVFAFKTVIENNQNYQMDVEYAGKETHRVQDYDLVILHQLPSVDHPVPDILAQIKKLKKPTLFVFGTQSSIPSFNKAQDIVVVNSNTDKYSDVLAAINKDFSLFTLSDHTLQVIPKLPPIHNFFGRYTASPAAKVLMQQKINSVNTDFPLWAFTDVTGQKEGVIMGEGVWRWRLYDYMLNKNMDATDELINKTIQFLSVKEDKRPFRVNVAKNIFQDNEAITFDAQLYNANYELVNTPEVKLVINREDGQSSNYQFTKTEKAYHLNVGFLPVGSYSYSATTQLGNNRMNVSGKFSVSPVQLEQMRTRADYQVLYQLAAQHHGSLHSLNNMQQIADEIAAQKNLKPVMYDSFVTESAINLKWIFFLLLLLISLEWGLRKYLGGY